MWFAFKVNRLSLHISGLQIFLFTSRAVMSHQFMFCFYRLFWAGYKLIGSHSGVKLCRWTKVNNSLYLKENLWCPWSSDHNSLWHDDAGWMKSCRESSGLWKRLMLFFKAMLRGRGGCYKHTFYGIESHRCMETTPSLACANKCVFCWRWVWSAASCLYIFLSFFLF